MKKRLVSLLLAAVLLTALLPVMSASAAMSPYYVYTENRKPLNMRCDHSTSSEIVAYIPFGAQVYCQTYNGTWMYVNYNGTTGYCMSRYLVTWKPTPIGPTAKPTSTPNIGLYRNMVKTDYYVLVRPSNPAGFVNMRWAPSTNEAVNNIYYANYQLHVIAQDSVWAQVIDEQSGYSGFMMLEFLNRISFGTSM